VTTTKPRLGSRFLDPATLAEIRDLRLVARTLVEGFLVGGHASARPSPGFEFRQYRAYEPGDDPRQVDWKIYGRSDRLVVRESQSERDLTVRFVLDATASMGLPATASPAAIGGGGGLRVFDTARFLVAALAYLVELQGDRLRLDVVRDGQRTAVPLGSGGGRAELLALFHALESLDPTGTWPADPRSDGARREREMVVVVSDLHCESDLASAVTDPLLEAIRRPRAAGREVLVFQLASRLELSFPFEGDVLFEDVETGWRTAGNAARMKAPTLEALARRRAEIRRRVLAAGAVHELLAADEPLDRALRDFLRRRERFG
jgi:uncharacterized protein (DUF58 family)